MVNKWNKKYMAKLKYYDNDNNNLKFDSKYLNGRKEIE